MKFNKKYLPKTYICCSCNREFQRSHFCKSFYLMYDYETLYIKYYINSKAEEYNFNCNINDVQKVLNSFVKNLLFV